MQIGRRKLCGSTVLLVLGGALPFLVGCGIFSDILAWTNVAGVALDGIVAALGNYMPPGGGQIIQLIKAFLQDLAGAVTEYQNDTNPADKATLLAKIRTLLSDIATNFESFLAQINLGTNPIVNVVLGLAQVILAAIMGFLGQLPGAPRIPAMIRLSGETLQVTPKYYKYVSDFKADYNAVCILYTRPELEIH